MASIRWKTKIDIDHEEALELDKQLQVERFKDRAFGSLSQKEVYELIEMMAKQLGLL